MGRILAGRDRHLLEKASKCWVNHWETDRALLAAGYDDQGDSGATDSLDSSLG